MCWDFRIVCFFSSWKLRETKHLRINSAACDVSATASCLIFWSSLKQQRCRMNLVDEQQIFPNSATKYHDSCSPWLLSSFVSLSHQEKLLSSLELRNRN
jgi:hypothetical protein